MIKLIKSVAILAKRNPFTAGFLLILIICPLLGTSVIAYILATLNIETLREASVLKISFLYLFFSFTMAYGITPTTVIACASGYILGWNAVPYMILSYGLAQWLGFKAAKWFGADRLVKDIIELDAYRGNLLILSAIKNEWKLVFLCRLSPVLPFGIMNFVLSVMQVRLLPFLISGLAGMLPRTLFFIWVGVESEKLIFNPGADWGERCIWAAVSAISVYLIIVIMTREFKKSMVNSESK